MLHKLSGRHRRMLLLRVAGPRARQVYERLAAEAGLPRHGAALDRAGAQNSPTGFGTSRDEMKRYRRKEMSGLSGEGTLGKRSGNNTLASEPPGPDHVNFYFFHLVFFRLHRKTTSSRYFLVFGKRAFLGSASCGRFFAPLSPRRGIWTAHDL